MNQKVPPELINALEPLTQQEGLFGFGAPENIQAKIGHTIYEANECGNLMQIAMTSVSLSLSPESDLFETTQDRSGAKNSIEALHLAVFTRAGFDTDKVNLFLTEIKSDHISPKTDRDTFHYLISNDVLKAMGIDDEEGLEQLLLNTAEESFNNDLEGLSAESYKINMDLIEQEKQRELEQQRQLADDLGACPPKLPPAPDPFSA